MGAAFFQAPILVGGLLLLGGAVWGLLGLLIMKEITWLEFVIYLGAFLGLVMLGALVNDGFLMIVFVLGCAFPFIRMWGNSHALAVMERQDIARYKLTVEKHPELDYPYEKLGEIYFKRGHFREAAKWYERFLELKDDPEVKHRLKRSLEFAQRDADKVKRCTECFHDNSQEARYCVDCGAILPGIWEFIDAFRGKKGTNYLITVAAASLVVGVLLGALTTLPSIIVQLIFLNAAAALVYLFYKRVTAY